MSATHVVTCFLRNRGEVLLLRRSQEVGSYAGRWGAVAGYAEEDPDGQALVEIDEETGLAEAVTLVRAGAPFDVHDEALGKHWVVHPYLFDSASRDVKTDWETQEAVWASPTSILQRTAVPELWTSYERVAPSLETIRDDRAHGSAYLSLRALEVLRDRAAVRAAEGASWQGLRQTARELLQARPSMAALHNRVHRAMQRAAGTATASAVQEAAHDVLQEAVDADEAATVRAAALVAGGTVLTLSRSGTILKALLRADPAPAVIVAASQPEGEGVGVAETLAEAGLDVTLVADAAVAHVLATESVDAVLVGADAVLPSGRVVNKTGTHAAALAARAAGVPFYVACASDKVRPDERPDLEPSDPSLLYDGEADVRVQHTLFDVTPARLVTAVVTECGRWRPGEVGRHAHGLRRLRAWQTRRSTSH